LGFALEAWTGMRITLLLMLTQKIWIQHHKIIWERAMLLGLLCLALRIKDDQHSF
jgi:hypothetical protein